MLLQLSRAWRRIAPRAVLPNLVLPLALVAVMSVAVALAVSWSSVEFDAIIFLIPVMISAVRWGVLAAVVAALASAAISDFFFLPPIFSFEVSDPREIVNLVLFLVVAIVTGHLAARLRSEADEASRRESEISDLYLLSRRLAMCSTPVDLVAALQEYVSGRLGFPAIVIWPAGDEAASDAAIVGPAMVRQLRMTAATMIAAKDTSTRTAFDPERKDLWVLRSMVTPSADHGVLAICLGQRGSERPAEVDGLIEAILSEGAASLARIDAGAAFEHAVLRGQSAVLKTALIGSASHELRSPIASILGSASVLDQIPSLQGDRQVRELVSGIHREAKRLDGDIQNLLDTARILDSSVVPVAQWTDPGDIIAAAIQQRAHRLSEHRLEVGIEDAIPLLKLDAGLVEQAIGQILENAAKYSPPGSTIAVSIRSAAGEVIIAIADEGVGLMPGEDIQSFRRGFRGARQLGGTPGLGLGLWIAKIFIVANGGAVTARSAGPGLGTTLTLTFPVPQRTDDIPSDAEVR